MSDYCRYEYVWFGNWHGGGGRTCGGSGGSSYGMGGIEGKLYYNYRERYNRLFIRGAIRDKAVVYPNNVWGYGRLDLMGVLSSLV